VNVRLAALAAGLAFPALVRAQVAAQTAAAPAPVHNDSACTYSTCALTIAPRWNGLHIKRGTAGPTIANLHFFWPIDITAELRGTDSTAAGADSAAAHAWRAVTLRRAGAGFTDLGAVVATVTLLRSLARGRFGEREQVLAGAAIGAFAVSVPLHFAADGELSRAVWWHNLRFGR
jgi:hypothetical protein